MSLIELCEISCETVMLGSNALNNLSLNMAKTPAATSAVTVAAPKMMPAASLARFRGNESSSPNARDAITMSRNNISTNNIMYNEVKTASATDTKCPKNLFTFVIPYRIGAVLRE